MSELHNYFVDIILPLAVPQAYTYAVPPELLSDVSIGKRVIVQFGKTKLYAGLVAKIHQNTPELYKAKSIKEVLDLDPVIQEWQIDFWNWMATYYMCGPGEVMQAAVPSGFRLSSETRVSLNDTLDSADDLGDEEYLIYEALHHQDKLALSDIQAILGKKSVFPIVRSLLDKGVVNVEEEVQQKYKALTATIVRLSEEFHSEKKLKAAFSELERAPAQLRVLQAFMAHCGYDGHITRPDLLKLANTSASQLKQLSEKGIFDLTEEEVSRLRKLQGDLPAGFSLSNAQQNAFNTTKQQFQDGQKVVLLHGITSSGKTAVYIEWINELIAQGKQVLFMLPEIALTTQIISRLRHFFGEHIGVYHSRFSDQERVEIWHKVRTGEYKVVLGARSSLFLPFKNLGGIIVDEEHDGSYKQYHPAPRYNARDSAIYLGRSQEVPVLLGTATPSMESYYHARAGRYGLVKLDIRYGGMETPDIHVLDLIANRRKGSMKSMFSAELLDSVKKHLQSDRQVILFQNRRGFSPYVQCEKCAHIPECKNCDVSLTYHKGINELRCHYCGFRERSTHVCQACGSHEVKVQGFGTEKIESELQTLLPEVRSNRLDLDTVQGKYSHERIISSFESGEINVLVGTQMVTKGLDFDKVGLVGILNADQLLSYPDFRANERAYQLMAQVSGRSGRKGKRGEVIIQTTMPKHPVINQVVRAQFDDYYADESIQRQKLHYPPYYRLIKLTLKHKDARETSEAAIFLAEYLRKSLGKRVLGPADPIVPRIRNQFHKDILLKISRKDDQLSAIKAVLKRALEVFSGNAQHKKVRVIVDVDPD